MKLLKIYESINGVRGTITGSYDIPLGDCDSAHDFLKHNMGDIVSKGLEEVYKSGGKPIVTDVTVTVDYGKGSTSFKVNWSVSIGESKDGKAWLGFTTRGSGCGDEIELRAGNDSARYKNGIQNVKSRVIEKYNEPNTEVKQLEKPFTFTDPINPKKTDKEDSYSFKQFWYVYTKPNREKQLGGGPGLKTSSTITVDDLNF
jgi:hypothetical protein